MRLTSSTPADEPEVIEFGHLVLHDGCTVPKFGTAVFVITGSDCDDCAVHDFAESHDFEADWEGFVRAPMSGEYRAHDVGRTRSDELAGMFGEQGFYGPFGEQLGGNVTLGVHFASPARVSHGQRTEGRKNGCRAGVLGSPGVVGVVRFFTAVVGAALGFWGRGSATCCAHATRLPPLSPLERSREKTRV